MTITALGYLGVHSDKLDDWAAFAAKQIGMQPNDKTKNTLSFRMDHWKQRFVVSKHENDQLAFIGWEVEHKTDLDQYGARLDNANINVTIAPKQLADQRCVSQLIYFDDPCGNRVELFHGPETTADPFTPGRPISGFQTGPYGLGHAVLHEKNIAPLIPFYRDLLDFRVSDYGLTPVPLYFFHVNGRHHSFALIESGRSGFHHFMVEYRNLDDVGQGYDLAQLRPDGVAYALGRHTNDYMTSFYATSPSGFFVEHGWGGRIIDLETWQPHETHCGPSFWGHERLHLPVDKRKHFRDMRLNTAARGERAPEIIDCPWLYQNIAPR